MTHAQQKGQYIPGQSGLNAGVLPEAGISYANLALNYFADTLRDSGGGVIPLSSDYSIWADENIVYFVPKHKILGAKYGFMMTAVTPANGSLTLGALNFPNVAVNGGGTGIADTWVQPLTLGWSLKHVDTYVAYAFMAPTGRYTPGATTNVGSGYWGNNIYTGTTAYLTKNKATTANIMTNWEIHGNKTTGAGTTMTPGQAFTIEWGLGQIIPIKKNFSQLAQLGVVGYDQWQVTDNGGLLFPNVAASATPSYSVHAIGFQANYLLPPKNLTFFFKFEPEYRALARPQGRTIAFGGIYTFRIPKPSPPPKP